MKKKFFKSIKKALGDDLVGIIVYGGAASERVFSGVSDIDFFIILKRVESLSKPLSEVYGALSIEIHTYLEDPLFSSLLDYDIYLENQLPQGDKLNGFSPIRALALSTGELLVGSNPFEKFKVADADLKSGARRMIQEYLEKLSSLMFMAKFEVADEESEVENENFESDKEFLAVDSILSSVQAYQMVKRGKYVSMPDVVLYAEIEPLDGIDNELIRNVGLIRQGVEADISDLYEKALDFCGLIIKLINEI